MESPLCIQLARVANSSIKNDFMAGACPPGYLAPCQFTQLLVDQQPYYDKMIIEDIRPEDGWILHVETGNWEAHTGTNRIQDRFNHVWPNVTKIWRPVVAGNCIGTPCDQTEHTITWGSSRISYFLEKQSWATGLLCWDQMLHVTHAKEQLAYIISDLLKPATSAINSNFLRKRAAGIAGQKWIANSTFGQTTNAFVFNWVQTTDADGELAEIFMDCNANPNNVFKLVPQMLQSRFQPLCRVGYLGKQPFKDMPPNVELVADMDTVWELDRLGGVQGVGGIPSIAANWRFTEWDNTSKYWKYGFNGTIGNFVTRADPFNLRFNYVGVVGGLFRYQVILPFLNIASSGAGGGAGLKDIPNPAFDRAQFRFSYIWHRKAMRCLMADATPVNPEMPFSARNFAGQWQFVMDNLGQDSLGNPIENKRRNKGQFIADFEMGIQPEYTEFLELIFHKCEPQCIPEVNTCAPDPGYPTQHYSSADVPCPNTSAPYTLTFTPVLNGTNGDYEVEVDGIECEGVQVQHGAIQGTTTIADLVAQLNAVAPELGTWSVAGANTIQLVGTCASVMIPWVH